METKDRDEWIGKLIDEFHKPIFKYCYHVLRQRQDAEDAAQEVFVKAMKHDGNRNDIQFETAWLYRIAHNHCLNVLKRRKLLSFLPFVQEHNMDPMLDDSLARVEASAAIDRLLSHLSSMERSIMVLRVMEDRSYEEIGSIINASPVAARKRFERAKRKLQNLFQAEKGELEHEKSNISYI